MELNSEQIKKIEEIESVLCGYFHIGKQDIINDLRTMKASTTRYFLWYILHFELGMSSLTIARMYLRTPRAVKMGCSKIKFRIKTHRRYKNEYDELMQNLSVVISEYKKTFVNV